MIARPSIAHLAISARFSITRQVEADLLMPGQFRAARPRVRRVAGPSRRPSSSSAPRRERRATAHQGDRDGAQCRGGEVPRQSVRDLERPSGADRGGLCRHALVELSGLPHVRPLAEERVGEREDQAWRDRGRGGDAEPNTRKPARLSQAMTDMLRDGPPGLRRAYVCRFVDRVVVSCSEIGISGPTALLARAAAAKPQADLERVLALVQEWRAECDEDGNWDVAIQVRAGA